MKRKTAIKRKPPEYPSRKLISIRKEWASQFSNCMNCGSVVTAPGEGYATTAKEVHHIAGRGTAPGKFEHLCNLLMLCRECHSALHSCGDIHGTGYAAALACKSIYDPHNYDLEKWFELYGNRTSFLEVRAAMDQHWWLRGEFVKWLRRTGHQ